MRGFDDGRGVDAGRGFDKNVQAIKTPSTVTPLQLVQASARQRTITGSGDDQIGGAATMGGWTDRTVASFTYDAESTNSSGTSHPSYKRSNATASTVANDGSIDGARPRNIVLLYVIKTQMPWPYQADRAGSNYSIGWQ